MLNRPQGRLGINTHWCPAIKTEQQSVTNRDNTASFILIKFNCTRRWHSTHNKTWFDSIQHDYLHSQGQQRRIANKRSWNRQNDVTNYRIAPVLLLMLTCRWTACPWPTEQTHRIANVTFYRHSVRLFAVMSFSSNYSCLKIILSMKISSRD